VSIVWKHSEHILIVPLHAQVNSHLENLFKKNSGDSESKKHIKRKLKMLYYVSALFAFRQVLTKCQGKAREPALLASSLIHDKMSGDKMGHGLTEDVIDGMIERFMEGDREGNG
jgi:hypothetical protein